jgi:hypothetical protein
MRLGVLFGALAFTLLAAVLACGDDEDQHPGDSPVVDVSADEPRSPSPQSQRLAPTQTAVSSSTARIEETEVPAEPAGLSAQPCAGIDPAVPASAAENVRTLALELLPDTFELVSVLHCNYLEGQFPEPHWLETTWRHVASGYAVQAMRRLESAEMRPELDTTNRSIWLARDDGFAYGAWVPPPNEAAAGEYVQDALADDILAEAVAWIARDIDLECFYRRVPLSWDDLAAMGIADFRASLPPDFNQTYFSFSTVEEPAPGCDVVRRRLESDLELTTGWRDSTGRELTVSLSNYSDDQPAHWPMMDPTGINWSSNGRRHYVGVYNGELAQETMLAIAAALDPNFVPDCVPRERQLTEEDLPELGLAMPHLPTGYELTSVGLMERYVAEGCPDYGDNAKIGPSVHLSWQYVGPAGETLSVSVLRPDGVGEPRGERSQAFIFWSNGETNYNVVGSAPPGGSLPAFDLLAQVALSLDPDLDVSSLPEVEIAPEKFERDPDVMHPKP